MRVLLINNYHYLRGGSERAYLDMGKILEENGHEVVAYFSTRNEKNFSTRWSKYFVEDFDLSGRHSLKNKLKIIARFFYNFEAKKKLSRLLDDFQPDVVHLHNFYHHLGPSIILELKKRKIPMVMTLHDYKAISPTKNLFCRGKIWEKDKGRKYYRCIFDKAVKNSYSKSLVCAFEAYVFKWLKVYEKVDIFISPSRFLMNKFKEYGFKGKIVCLANYLEDAALEGETSMPADPDKDQKAYLFYYGRLSQEKGVDDLIEAFKMIKSRARLLIAGDGEEKKNLEASCPEEIKSGKICFLGYRTGNELKKLILEAKAIVVPSRWQENSPYAILEAMQLKKTVICAKVGGIQELVADNKNGFLFQPGDRKNLTEIINKVLADGELKSIGESAREYVRLNHSADKFYQELNKIYIEAINKKL